MMSKTGVIHFLVAALVHQHFTGVFSGFSNERFGQNGKFLCRCADGDTCADDGTCTACAHGWEGHKCQIGKNVAEGATVLMSSTLAFWDRPASLVVDGDSRRDFYGAASCVSTGREKTPWLRLTLKKSIQHVIQQITISTLAQDLFAVQTDRGGTNKQSVDLFPELADGHLIVNHTECLLRCLGESSVQCKQVTTCNSAQSANGCWKLSDDDTPTTKTGCAFNERISNSLENLYIYIGIDFTRKQLCKSTPTSIAGDSVATITCDETIVGRYIWVELNNTENRPLPLCEIGVKGYRFIECRRGYHGITCDVRCTRCNSVGGCNKFTGKCCDVDKTGPQCEKRLPYLTQNPWITYRDKSSITVKWYAWQPGNGVGPVRMYCIRMKEEGSTFTPPCVNVNAPSTVAGQGDTVTVEHRIVGLAENIWYHVSVACYLTDGLGNVLGPTVDLRVSTTACKGTCADDSCNQDATQQEEGHNCVCLNGSRGRHCEKRKASKCGVKSSPGRCGQLPIKSISVTVP